MRKLKEIIAILAGIVTVIVTLLLTISPYIAAVMIIWLILKHI